MLGWLKHDVTSRNIYTLNVSIHIKQKIHSQTILIAQKKTLKTLSWHNKSCIWQPWKHLWSLSIARLTTLWQRIFRPQISRMTEVQTWKKNETREKLSLKGNLSSSKVLLSEWYLPWPVVTSVLRGQERRRVDRGQCVHLWDTKKREGEKKERACVWVPDPLLPLGYESCGSDCCKSQTVQSYDL